VMHLFLITTVAALQCVVVAKGKMEVDE
jgi:hypothetical protein